MLSKLQSLRSSLSSHIPPLHALYIGSEDAHLSEYVSSHDKRREFVSHFSGSAGTSLITMDNALLWTDARYHLQAEKQLDESWRLMRSGQVSPVVQSMNEYIVDNTPEDCNIGVDASLVSLGMYRNLSNTIGKRKLVSTNYNIVDKIWNEEQYNRPKMISQPINLHHEKFAGQSMKEKITMIQAKLFENNCKALVSCALDCNAWLFNLRGSDISFNPVFRSYGIVTLNETYLFLESKDALTEDAKNALDGIKILPYSSIFAFLSTLDGPIWIDPNATSYAVYSSIKSGVFEKESPIVLAKSCKNLSEVAGMRNAHIRDTAAMSIFLSWLEEQLHSGKTVTECSASDQLDECRARMEYHVGPSFETIAGFGSNGAIIHYKPEPETCKTLTCDDMFLLDSGGQYKDGGTTDITRTLHFGKPTEWQKNCYTHVLQGHIDLAMAEFPVGTSGPALDILARMPLWKAGLDYRHGTGHGVGSYLNVHEGPQGLGSTIKRPEMWLVALDVGMCISNEPGYYESGNFGIRIESVMTVRNVPKPNSFQNVKYLGFETLTLTPYQASLINKSLLSAAQIKWLNEFHQHSYKTVAPILEEMKEAKALEWLKRNTLPI